MARTLRDSVDAHVERWLPALPQLDAEVEGAVTRMQRLLWLLKRRKEQAWAEQGVTAADVNTIHVLVSLALSGEDAVPAVLAERCRVTRAGMTSRLDRLERSGYVTRTTDPADRRRVIVRLQDSGRTMWEAATEVGIRIETEFLETLSPVQRRQLNSLLRHMLAGIEATETPAGPCP